MRGPDAQYRCNACQQISLRTQLLRDSWGDPCCPACKSPHIERYRTKSEVFYNWFFTFRVF